MNNRNKIIFFIIFFQIFSTLYCSNIIVLNSTQYRSGHFAFNSNGDMIIEYSYNKNRLFYGLKKNGKYFFKDNSGNSIPTKEITLNYTNDAYRYEAKNIFVLINEKEYLFSIAIDSSVAELYDLNNDNDIQYKIIPSKNFIGNTMFSYVFSLLEMNTNPKKYLISYVGDGNYQLKTFNFSNFGFEVSDYSVTSTSNPYSISFGNRIVSCFLMGDEIVVFLVRHDQLAYELYIYNTNLEILNDGNLAYIDSISNFNNGYGLFSKAYHLTNRDAIFAYFNEPNFHLKIKTGTIGTNHTTFTSKIEKSLSDYNFYHDVLLSDFIKINSERFVYIGVPKTNTNKTINIILFDLYNDYKSMNIRIYKETLNNEHVISQEISGDVFNGHLIFTCTAKKTGEYSILMIFGYANITDKMFDISDYFMDDDNNNSNNLFDKLLENVEIENNIFSYTLLTDVIKMVSIPEEILFYNKTDNSEILVNNGDTLYRDYTFKQNQSKEKTDQYYYFEYQPIIEEPSYNNYNNNTIAHIEVNSQTQYQNIYIPNRFYGRTVTIKFKLCHKYCEKCFKFGKSDNNQLCTSCLPNYRYFYNNEFNNNCIPNGYFYDKEAQILTQCSDDNSKFYFDLNENKKICFKKIYECPEEYHYYNETNNECINYTAPIPTTIFTTITTTIPTTILTTIPTTILTTMPTTILTTIPTTMLTTIITTSIPTTIATTIPTTIPTTISTTITTTIPTTILTTIPTTIITTIPTTILTTVQLTEKIASFICNYEEFLNEKCSFKNKTNQEIYDIIKKEILPSFPPDGKSIVINGTDNYVFQITNNKNELETLNGSISNEYNLSMIDLAECGEALKETNSMDDESSLNILKFEKKSNLTIEKNIQYEIFEINSNEKLNLSICKDKPVDIYVPLELSSDTKIKYEDLKSQGYDLFDKNSEFYTDICTPYKSPDGTDVSLAVRNSEFYNSTETSCQENCEYGDYLSDSSFLKCVCSVVEDDIDLEKPEKFTGLTFLLSFYEVIKNSNYEVLKCHGLTFKLINFIINIGSIVTMALFLLYLIFVIMYIITGIKKLRIEISKIMDEKNFDKSNKIHMDNNMENNIELKEKNRNIQRKEKSVLLANDANNIKINNRSKFKSKTKKIINKKRINNKLNRRSVFQAIQNNIIIKNNLNNYPPKKFQNKIILSRIQNDIIINKSSKDSKESNFQKLLYEKEKPGLFSNKNNDIAIIPNESINKKEENNYKYTNIELNELDYLEAIKYDKRTFCQIYWSILNREHLILFTFFSWGDYNLTSVKFARFFFFICTDMAMNIFFFTDDSMHKIYKNYGKWNFVQNIPQIIYSLLVSQGIQVLICFLTLTDKYFYQIKRSKFEKSNSIEIFKILKCIKIKLCIFYVITFVLFIFYWYAVTSFCAVYKNTQIIFIKDSLSSFLGGILYPFPLYLFPALLRIISLKSEKKNLSCLYKLSDFIPIF